MMKTKDATECIEMIEDLATRIYTEPNTNSGTATVAPKGIHSVESSVALAVQVESLAKMMKDIQVKMSAKCELCRGGHDTVDCPTTLDEELSYVQNQGRGWQPRQYQQPSNYRSGGPPGFQPRQSLFQTLITGQPSGSSIGQTAGASSSAPNSGLAEFLRKNEESQNKTNSDHAWKNQRSGTIKEEPRVRVDV